MTNGYSLPQPRIRRFYNNYSWVTWSWLLIISVSIFIGIYSSVISTEATRSIVVQPLLIGVITLFTITLTVTIMGIQVASNRYTHRADSIVIRKLAFWLHFLPHLIAILFAILMILGDRFLFSYFFVFIFSISASLLGIFPFLQWLLKTLSPEMMLSISLNSINSDFLNKVEEVVRDERSQIMEGNDRERVYNIFREMTYLEIPDDGWVDRSMDIVRSRILNTDTGTARSLIEKYSVEVESVLEHRYQEFRTSHSDSQLVAWYLLGSFEDLFQLAIKEENHRITKDIISLQRRSIQNWFEKDVNDVPEVFFQLFNSISVEYLSHCNSGQAKGVAREYRQIASIIASDIDSSSTKISGAITMNFVTSCMAFAERSINQGYVKSASLIRSSLRSIVDARLRNPPSDPDRELLMIGLIGEMFASEEAVTKNIVEIANETSVINEAEWVITTLVTFKDKIEGDEQRELRDEILEKVLSEIERVNEALEESDREAASKVPYDEELVLEVIRGARLFRAPFSANELIEELEISGTVDDVKIEEICTELEELGVLEDREEGKYKKSSK